MSRTQHLQHLQEVKEEVLPPTPRQYVHNSFTDEELGGDGNSSTTTTTVTTKVSPDRKTEIVRTQGGVDPSTTYGKSQSHRSRLPWDEAEKEEYRPAPSTQGSCMSCFSCMPTWLWTLLGLTLLGLSIAMIISALRGFNMAYPHVQIVNLQLPLPYPYSDATGSIPVTSTILFSNYNKFGFSSQPTNIQFFALPTRTPASLLATAPTNGMRLAPHEKGHVLQTMFYIPNINGVDGGRFMVNAVVQGDTNFLYTRSIHRIRAKALGLIPVTRSYKSECTIMKKWGVNTMTISDCYGRFL